MHRATLVAHLRILNLRIAPSTSPQRKVFTAAISSNLDSQTKAMGGSSPPHAGANQSLGSQQGGSKRKAIDARPDPQAENPSPQAVQPKQKKKFQDLARARAAQLYGEIATKAKQNHLAGAMASFHSAVTEGISLNSGLLNTLLYLAVGGGHWEVYARTGKGPDRPSTLDQGQEHPSSLKEEPLPVEGEVLKASSITSESEPSSHPPLPPPEKETLVSFATSLWEHMQKAGIKPDNGTFLALARLSAIMGQPDSALKWAHECRKQGHQVSLRLYHPAIISLIVKGGDKGMAAAVEGIDEEIAKLGREHSLVHLDLTEQEYALILEAYTLFGSWTQVASVLHRMGRELGPLSLSTIAIITAFFQGPRSQEAFLPSSHAIREKQQAEKEVHLKAEVDQRNAEQREKIEASRAQLLRGDASSQGQAHPRPTFSPNGQREGKSLEAPGAEASTSGRAPSPPPASGLSGRFKKAHVITERFGEEEEEEIRLKRRRRAWLGYPLGDSIGWEVEPEAKVDVRTGEIIHRVSEPSAGSRLVEDRLKLEVEDLEEDEWASFASSVASLALTNEKKQDFQQFVEWFDRNGPYDILVDGANVAFYGQNREGGGFCWPQVMDMVKMLKKEYPTKKILLLLHKRRVTDSQAKRPAVRNFIEELDASNNFYCTPFGSNDDWYWLYATVRAKAAGLLVSNDELRDHIWSLLRPKHFLKWKAMHISHYTFSPNGRGDWTPALQTPPPYSSCVQELSDGSWMIPRIDGVWIRIRPRSPEASPQT